MASNTVSPRRLGGGRLVAMIAALLIVALAAWIIGSYARDIRHAWARVSTGSQLIQTPCGPIEYAEAGSGAPILFIHGAGGGYDQGLDIGGELTQQGFRVIAMSRFGYLRTPLPTDASPEKQAEAHACLLDALHVERAAVIGLSAGGPSAMQFTLKYPQRTSALVLMVAAAYPSALVQREGGATPANTSAFAQALFDAALKSDLLLWAAPRIAPSAVDRVMLGTPPQVIAAAAPAERRLVDRTFEHLLPFSARRLGVLNDSRITPFVPRYDLEHITAPTLILSTEDDGFGTYAGARYSAEHIPGARLILYPSGGHLLVGHMYEALSEVSSFLKRR
jgi:pimeloyl-ACP methyl ester carboxylesterase